MSPNHTVHSPPNGRGPGLLLLGGAAPTRVARAEQMAEEGYVVVTTAACAPMEARVALDGLAGDQNRVGGMGAIAHGAAGLVALELAIADQIDALVLYDVPVDAAVIAKIRCPTVLQYGLARSVERDKIATLKSAGSGRPHLEVYAYQDAAAGFADEASPDWEPYAAGIAYSRALALLRRVLGPHYNLSDLWDRHLECEFVLKDATANMKTMVAEPYVNHVPTMTGGVGHDLLKRFYTYHFIPQAPRDRRTIPISRTVGVDRIVEEKVFCFTHTDEMDWLLPGVKPTGKYVEIPFVVVVSFRGDKLYNEHIYWDQASLLAQLGLIDPKGLPIAGVEQARKMLDKSLPSNTLMSNWKTSEGKPI